MEVLTDLTSTHVPMLRRDLQEVLEEQHANQWRYLYLDARGARMIDATGINWLLAENVRLTEDRKQLVLRISSPAIHRVIQFVGLDKLAMVKYRRRKQTR